MFDFLYASKTSFLGGIINIIFWIFLIVLLAFLIYSITRILYYRNKFKKLWNNRRYLGMKVNEKIVNINFDLNNNIIDENGNLIKNLENDK